MFDEGITGATARAYMMLKLAREGIPPSEFKMLTAGELQRILGALDGEAEGQKHRRGDYS